MLVSWQAKNIGWQPPTADWIPPGVPDARPAPAGWQFWVPNPILLAAATKTLTKKALVTVGVGAAMFLFGIIATIVDESMASSGGRFFVFTGLILVGLLRIIMGIVRLVRAPLMAKRSLSTFR